MESRLLTEEERVKLFSAYYSTADFTLEYEEDLCLAQDAKTLRIVGEWLDKTLINCKSDRELVDQVAILFRYCEHGEMPE